MKKNHFDISTVPRDGYLIFPLSMSRLAHAQSPAVLYDFLKFFEAKIQVISLDVIFLYTNDLYLNVEDFAVEVRKKVLNQMINHKSGFLNILLKEKKYVPSAFHFLPWDYAVLNATEFHEIRDHLFKAQKNTPSFHDALHRDLENAGRKETEANVRFLIEEIAVSHLLVQKQIPMPHTLATPDGWRLLCYPGDPLYSWVFVYKNNLLSKRNDLSKSHSLFARSFYNMEKKILIDFDTLTL